MSKFNYTKLAFWTAAVVVVSGVAFYFVRQSELLKKTCFNFKSAMIIKLGLARTIINVNLELKNKSDIPFDITGLDLNVLINGIQVSRIKNAIVKTLPANSATLFPLVVEFSPKDTIKSAANLQTILGMATNPNVMFTFSGSMSIRSSYLVLGSLPIEESMTLKELKSPSSEKC